VKRALASLCAVFALGACQTLQTPTPPLTRAQSELSNVQVVTSPGGITAWLVSETFVPSIAMQVSWQGGSAAEPVGKDGLGWVLGYMMNEGAGDMDTTAYGARMQDLNMEFACGVWVDWTTCGLSTLKATADDSFEMMRLAFNKLRMDDEPFERAKRELAVGLKESESNPKSVSGRAMNDALIPGHPYARYATAETVSSIRKQDVIALKSRLMTRDRLMVVVVGDITAEELKPKLDLVFGTLPTGQPPMVLPDAVAKSAQAHPIIKQLPQPQTLILFSGPGVRRDDPDFFAAYTLNYILGGGGFSSRLVDDVRERRGLTYGIATGLSIQPHYWRWTGSTSTMNDKAEEVIRLIRENIARLGKDGPTEAELVDAKAYLTGAFPLSFDSNAKTASNLLGFWQDGQGADYVQHRNEYFEAVTLDDLKRVASQYMKPEDFTFVMVGQPVTD
jgi:zinc protease